MNRIEERIDALNTEFAEADNKRRLRRRELRDLDHKISGIQRALRELALVKGAESG